MNLFRYAGWVLLLSGAGLFVGEVEYIGPFVLGWLMIIFNPVGTKPELLNMFKKVKKEQE